MNGDLLKMSKVRRDWSPNSTRGTPRPPNISLPLISLDCPSTLWPTSQIPWIQSPPAGLQVNMCWDTAPLRWGWMSVFILFKVYWPKFMSFSWLCPSSDIGLELCLGMFHYTWPSGHSSVWSLRITTVLGKVPLCVFTIVHYKTQDNHCASLFVCSYPINSPFWSISESRSGLVIVSPSQPANENLFVPDKSSGKHSDESWETWSCFLRLNWLQWPVYLCACIHSQFHEISSPTFHVPVSSKPSYTTGTHWWGSGSIRWLCWSPARSNNF